MSASSGDVLVVVGWAVLLFGLPIVSAVILALGLGRSWLRLLAVAAAGVGVFAAAAVVSLVTDCDGCTPELGVVLAGYVLAGWLVGLVVAVVVRLFKRPHPGRAAMLLAVALLVPVVALVGAGRRSFELTLLGCPTQEDFERPESVEDVVEAFEDAGMPLEPIPLPLANPRAGPKYRGAVAFRNQGPGATLFVAVCRQRCPIIRFYPPPGERWYSGGNTAVNVPVWVTQSKLGGGRRLFAAAEEPLNEVGPPHVEYGSRCYIG